MPIKCQKEKVEKMKCPKCESKLIKDEVSVENAEQKAASYQCQKCDYFEFEQESAAKVVKELKMKESPLKIKQKIVKISKDRLGIYFNKNVVESLELEAGENIFVSVPDRKHIVLKLGN